MRKLRASIIKEIQLILQDRVGLLLMYLMPILLVFIITIVQDSAFKLVKDNQLDLLVVNKDKGELGEKFTAILEKTGNFNLEKDPKADLKSIKGLTIEKQKLISIYIPENFSQNMSGNAQHLTKIMLTEFGMIDENSPSSESVKNEIQLFYDPVLQENFRFTLVNNLQTVLNSMENAQMVEQIFKEMGYDEIPEKIKKQLSQKQTEIKITSASNSLGGSIPNSTQHNVPAWSIFAMFFMVISLGGNLVKERLSGSFIRLQTIPSAFILTIWSKMVVYLFVALSQLAILFSIGVYLFPYLSLPQLAIPASILQLFVVSFLSAMAAISYSILVGTYAKTQEQANGFGSISIIMFAAIGGIWVPLFVMPDYLQTIAKLSPLHWCMEGFYTIFLKNGEWNQLTGPIIYLLLFTFACQFLTFIKLRIQNYI